MEQYKTRGIVLHQIKYSETSTIAKIYTEKFGLESFLIKGIRNSRSKVKQGLLQHLSLVDIVGTSRDLSLYNKKGGLKHLKEIKSCYNFKSIPFDVRKSSITLFINEVLYKSIKEEIKNEELFDFIFRSLTVLDEAEDKFSDFHFHFIVQLTKYLGFFPNNNYSENNNIFNIKEGMFQSLYSDDGYCMDIKLSKQFYHLIRSSEFGVRSSVSKNSEQITNYYVAVENRKELLCKIIDYYRIHVACLNEIRSNQVLETVFN